MSENGGHKRGGTMVFVGRGFRFGSTNLQEKIEKLGVWSSGTKNVRQVLGEVFKTPGGKDWSNKNEWCGSRREKSLDRMERNIIAKK